MTLPRILLLALSLAVTPVTMKSGTMPRLPEAEVFVSEYHVPETLAYQILRAADRQHIDHDLAFRLVRAESNFDPRAKGALGEIGLTQLRPTTARLIHRGVTIRELYVPSVNLDIGFKYLHELLDRYQGWTAVALTAYNAGTPAGDRLWKQLHYARRVLS